MDGKPKLPLIPGFTVRVSIIKIFAHFVRIFTTKIYFRFFQKPKENYHLPQYWLRVNGTNMLVEKRHADNNWIFNDGKVSSTRKLQF